MIKQIKHFYWWTLGDGNGYPYGEYSHNRTSAGIAVFFLSGVTLAWLTMMFIITAFSWVPSWLIFMLLGVLLTKIYGKLSSKRARVREFYREFREATKDLPS